MGDRCKEAFYRGAGNGVRGGLKAEGVPLESPAAYAFLDFAMRCCSSGQQTGQGALEPRPQDLHEYTPGCELQMQWLFRTQNPFRRDRRASDCETKRCAGRHRRRHTELAS